MNAKPTNPLFALAVAALCAAAAPALADPTLTPVMSGLVNPRGLALGPEGALYVAEAGNGSAGPPCLLLVRPSFTENICYGPDGAITRLWRGRQERVVTGLPSLSDRTIPGSNGPNDIAFLGRGQALVTIGLGTDPAQRGAFGPPGAQLGALIQVTPGGQWRQVSDVSAHEGANNPAGGPIDSNPFGLYVEAGSYLVADAGANALLRVAANGKVSTVATFPAQANPLPFGPPFIDSVPTSVSRGPDGAYYVGELTGGPFIPGRARVYRVDAGEPAEVFEDGFSFIIDLDFGPDGSLYVLEHGSAMFLDGTGRIVRVDPLGNRDVIVDGLDSPTSLLVIANDALYVTNHGISEVAGEVLRVDF